VTKKEVYRTYVLPVVLVCDAEGPNCFDTVVATPPSYVFICPHQLDHENDIDTVCGYMETS